MKHIPLVLFMLVWSPFVLAGFIYVCIDAAFLLGKEMGIRAMRSIA